MSRTTMAKCWRSVDWLGYAERSQGDIWMLRHAVRAVAFFAFAAFTPALAQAQSWPTRPVTMVVPFAAGGPMDVVGRIMAARLSDQLRQQGRGAKGGGG